MFIPPLVYMSERLKEMFSKCSLCPLITCYTLSYLRGGQNVWLFLGTEYSHRSFPSCSQQCWRLGKYISPLVQYFVNPYWKQSVVCLNLRCTVVSWDWRCSRSPKRFEVVRARTYENNPINGTIKWKARHGSWGGHCRNSSSVICKSCCMVFIAYKNPFVFTCMGLTFILSLTLNATSHYRSAWIFFFGSVCVETLDIS